MIELDPSEITELATAIRLLQRRVDRKSNYTRLIGPLLKRQTQDRIRNQKSSPSGEAWAPWSTSYAATRTSRHSLLIDTRELLKTLEWDHDQDTVEIRSPKPYSGYLQHGTRKMPAREFLGLSGANRRDIEDLAAEVLQGFLDQASGPE
jgi:phage virion morphogenesis protein